MKTTGPSPKERIIINISVPLEKSHILKQFDQLVRLERLKAGRSELTIRAWKEYVDHHWPGNPQETLLLPPSRLDPTRDRAAINFLRTYRNLSVRQIAKIVDRSKSYVSKHSSKTTKKRGRQVQRKTLNTYRERFNGWMAGRYKNLKEAFRIS